jgi:antitoxin (DNA-binding transcriptional repressor) of toxin-antitoxin stability system
MNNKQGETAMPPIILELTHATLAELIEQLPPGGEVSILRDGKPVATLKAALLADPPLSGWHRLGPGLLQGQITDMAPDFDAPLEDLREYMM